MSKSSSLGGGAAGITDRAAQPLQAGVFARQHVLIGVVGVVSGHAFGAGLVAGDEPDELTRL